jgi:hypothetical protein
MGIKCKCVGHSGTELNFQLNIKQLGGGGGDFSGLRNPGRKYWRNNLLEGCVGGNCWREERMEGMNWRNVWSYYIKEFGRETSWTILMKG